MVSKIKLKSLFADNIKKFKTVEKSNPELNFYGILFELSCCHTMSLEEIHKTLAKIKSKYMDFNEFRVTEVDDICADFNMSDRIDDVLTFIQCLDDVFEKNGTVDLAEISKYDDTKISALFSRLSGNINGSCFSYYLNRLGKDGPYVFSDNQVRILKRLKIVDEIDEFEAIKKKVEKVYPAEKGVSFFLACQVFANEYCREDNPSCTRCPFLSDCEFGKNIVKEREEKEKERELVRQKALEEEQRKIDSEKKKVKVSKKKDKNEDKEDLEADIDIEADEKPELSKKEKKKLLAEQLALEKAAKKLEGKSKKIKGLSQEAVLVGVETQEPIGKKKGSKGQKAGEISIPTVVESKKVGLKDKKAETSIVKEISIKKGELKPSKKNKEEIVGSAKNIQAEVVSIKVDKKLKKAMGEKSLPPVEEIKGTKTNKKVELEKNISKVSGKQVPVIKKEDKKQKGKLLESKLPEEIKDKKSEKKGKEKASVSDVKVLKNTKKPEKEKKEMKTVIAKAIKPIKNDSKKLIKKEIKPVKVEKKASAKIGNKDKSKSDGVKKEKSAKQVKAPVNKASSKSSTVKKSDSKKKK